MAQGIDCCKRNNNVRQNNREDSQEITAPISHVVNSVYNDCVNPMHPLQYNTIQKIAVIPDRAAQCLSVDRIG